MTSEGEQAPEGADKLYAFLEERLKEAERERKRAKERLKLLAGEIRDIKIMLQRHQQLERHLPKDSPTRAKRGGQRRKANGESA